MEAQTATSDARDLVYDLQNEVDHLEEEILALRREISELKAAK